MAELPDGFQEREALDVADRAPDLGDDNVVPVGEPSHARLYLVRDVGHDLNGGAQVVAASLLADDRLVDAARRDVVRLRE